MTGHKFEQHNKHLKTLLIDNEPEETYFTVDPNDDIFDKPLNEL